MARSLLKIALALLTSVTSGCLLLQDAPVNGVGGECEADDWCESGLVCLRRYGNNSPGECNKKGACFVDSDCPSTSRCEAPSYSIGTCKANTGCLLAGAQCGAGKTCVRDVCWQLCTFTSECGTNATCREVECPGSVSCPNACQPF